MTQFHDLTEIWVFATCPNRNEPPESVSYLNGGMGLDGRAGRHLLREYFDAAVVLCAVGLSGDILSFMAFKW